MQDKPFRPKVRKKTLAATSPRDAVARRIARRLRAGRNNTNYAPHIIGATVLACAVFLLIVAVMKTGRTKTDITAPVQRQVAQPYPAQRPAEAAEPAYREPAPPANLCQEGKQADTLLNQAKDLMRDWNKTRAQDDLNKAKKILQQAESLYTKAAELSPDEKYIKFRLNQAKQLRYFAMKSSSI